MKTRMNGFLWIGLGVALLLALFLSPFASSSPDGLERIAERYGFADKESRERLWDRAPLAHYSLPGIKNEKLSTALAGLAGTLAIFFLVLGIGSLAKRPSGPLPACREK